MIRFGEASLIIFFRPMIRRIKIKECPWSIINPNQVFKVLVLDYNTLKPLLNKGKVLNSIGKVLFIRSEGSAVRPEAHLNNMKESGCSLDVRKSPAFKLVLAVKELFSRYSQPFQLSLQFSTMILDAPIQVDQITVSIIEGFPLYGL